MLSIITTVKKRYKSFVYFVDVVSKIKYDYELCVSIFDEKKDYENFLNFKKINYKIITSNEKFSISKGKNLSYSISKGNIIFFVDCDVIWNDFFIKKIISNNQKNSIRFPLIYRWLTEIYPWEDKLKKRGKWADQCYGTVIGNKEDFELLKNDFNFVGPWNENYTKWGWEDVDLFSRCSYKKINILREKEEIFHLWHPMHKDLLFL